MSYPDDYNPNGLAPQIILLDKDGTEQYRFEHPQIDSNPTQDFKLISWHIREGINSEHGAATLVIVDHDNKLIDTTQKKRRLKIKNGWQLKIYLGKNAAGLEIWHHGIIEEPALHRPRTNLQYLSITSFGWGIRLAQRFANISHFQRKTDNGLLLDDTDETAKVSELVKRLVRSYDIFVLVGPDGELREAITANAVDDIDIKIPDFVRRFNSLGLMLNELAQMVGAIYGVGPDRDLFFRIRGRTDGGFLISNDVKNPDSITGNWNQDKIFFMRNQNFSFNESTIGSSYTTVIGIGAQHEELDHDETDANASLNLSSKYFAFPFIPTKENISKIALFLSKNSNSNSRRELHVKIIGSNDDGTPNPNDIKEADILAGSRLEDELETGRYFEIPFDKEPLKIDGSKLFVLIEKYGNTTHYLELDYQTGTGTYFDSSDGITFTERTGEAKMRTYHAQAMHIIAQNTVLKKNNLAKETTYSLKDFPNEESAILGLEGMLSVLGRTHRTYEPIQVSAPTIRPDIGKTVRLIDTFNGLDANVDLVGYDITASIENNNLSAVDMTLNVEEWF